MLQFFRRRPAGCRRPIPLIRDLRSGRCERFFLAAIFGFLVLPACRAEVSAESDGAAMARAPLPPALRAAPSGTERQQALPLQTGPAPLDPTLFRSSRVKHGEAAAHPSKNKRAAITKPDLGKRSLPKRLATTPEYHHHRHRQSANFAALRADKARNGHGDPGLSHDQEYSDPPEEDPGMAAPTMLTPPFTYTPGPPPGYAYPLEFRVPWFPGPTPPR